MVKTYDNFINDMVCQYGLDFLRLDQRMKDCLYNMNLAYLKTYNTKHREVFDSMGTFLYLVKSYKMN
jgi:hypothetical protein